METITLDTPIKRGDTTITTLDLKRPQSPALRGVSLRALLDFETDAILKVLPRISEPPITDAEAARLEAPDILQAGAKIAGFLLPKAATQEAADITSPTT